jgi:histidinol-phosphate/aromatic aminotransferase/cobyric acid decarboxylase-like protein
MTVDAAQALAGHLDPSVLRLPARLRTSRPEVLDLSRNELVHPRLPGLLAPLVAGAGGSAATRYPSPRTAVDRVAALLGRPPDEVALFPGSDDAIGVVVDALTRTRPYLLLQDPTYPAYRHHADLRQATVWPWLPRPHRLHFDVADAVRAMTAVPPCLVVATDPHGILGSRLADDDMAALRTVARRHGHLLVVDECYRAFAGIEPVTDAVRHPQFAAIGSFSKGFGLAGLRVGYVAADPALVDYLQRWRRSGAVSGVALHVLLALTDRHLATLAELRGEVTAGRDGLAARLREVAPRWTALPSAANFLTVDTGTPETADTFVRALAESGVLVRRHAGRGLTASLVQVTAAPDDLLRPVAEVAAAVARGADALTRRSG